MPASSFQLKNALQKPYDRVLFAKEVLSPIFSTGFSLSSTSVKPPVPPNKSESEVLKEVWIYGKISLDDGSEVTCYEIILQPNVRIEYSKVAIQQYVRKLLTAGQAALINFVSPTNKNLWRLTLVAKDSILTEKGIQEKATHSKRYTYLLGPSESCKTPADRFKYLSTQSKIDYESLVTAFSVERLSKAFFDEYTRHYEAFVDYLNDSNYKKSVFKNDEKAIRDFTKMLLGRIVFLYFIQKKGWLGAPDKQYKDGKQDFVMQIFKSSGGDETFYPKWLTILFFDTLNTDREDDNFTMPDRSKVKIPFLNGGLFDKEEYDDKLLTFDPVLFHNPNNDEDPKVRGFLDFLNAFNFTIYEDSPDEKTVAVDPEMLGHIFENLLEDNKDKGAYYTPKEIVHYMCQESLIEYLSTHLSKVFTVYQPIGSNQVEIFGDDTRVGQLNLVEEFGEKALNRNDVSEMVKTKDISNLTKEQLKLIDKLLSEVKICDPAIGSGAFPMGLLLEIYSIKELIAYKMGGEWIPSEVKENIIQNSIYGVDIEKGAVDIARLRFWLSLVVDEDQPKPLPNLDYKIVVGDSLVSKFDGEIVEIEWNRAGSAGKGEEYHQNIKRLLREVAEKQKKYFDPENRNKNKLSKEIRDLKIELLINQISLNKQIYINKNSEILDSGIGLTAKEKTKNYEINLQISVYDRIISKLKSLKNHANSRFEHFDWKLDFPEVLNPYLVDGSGGFDIVIANPPYISVRTKSFNKSLKNIFKQKYKLAIGQYDVYVLFLELTCRILNSNGAFSFIIPQRILSNENFEKARIFILNNMPVLKYVDVEMPFQKANVEANIILGTKSRDINKLTSYNYNASTKEFLHLSNIPYSLIEIMPFNIFPFILREDRLRVFELIQRKHFNTLKELLNITRGFECGYSDESIVNYETNYPLVKADAIQKYIILENDIIYCEPDFSKKSKYKTKDVFLKTPKLLTKFTSNEIVFAIDKKGYFNTNSVYNCHLKDDSAISYECLLIILNSRLITFWFNTAFLNIDTLFPHIQKNQLEAIPIIIPREKKIIDRLSRIIYILKVNKLGQVNQTIEYYYEIIANAIVYELYLPELLDVNDVEIIKNISDIPEIIDSMSNNKKLEIINNEYKRLHENDHPVKKNLSKLHSIPEIKIIEGNEGER